MRRGDAGCRPCGRTCAEGWRLIVEKASRDLGSLGYASYTTPAEVCATWRGMEAREAREVRALFDLRV